MFFCFFGFNESFAGEEGMPYFKQRYGQYLERLDKPILAKRKSPAVRVGLADCVRSLRQSVATCRQHKKTPTSRSTRRRSRKLPRNASCHSSICSRPQINRFQQETGLQYTIDGVHLNEPGDLLMAGIMDEALFEVRNPVYVGSSEYEKLRAAVNDKSWVHINDYRMLNGWYVYGGRRTYDTETFPLEYRKIRKMVVVRDRYVWDIAQGKPVAKKPDDSNTGELIVPPTGVGRHFPERNQRTAVSHTGRMHQDHESSGGL